MSKWPKGARGAGIIMKSKVMKFALLPMVLIATLVINGCKSDKVDAAAEAPPTTKVVTGVDVTFFAVEHPELYPIVTATEQIGRAHV